MPHLVSSSSDGGAATIPLAFVAAIVRAYGCAGRDASGALRAGGLAARDLEAPDGRITGRQMESICQAAMRELDDEALGCFERPLRWGAHAMLCRASLSSPDLGVALERWCRHFALLVDDVHLRIDRREPLARIVLEERRPLGLQREFALLSTLRNLHAVACWLVGAHIALRSAMFPERAPAHADAYARMLRTQVSFDQGHASIAFDARHLDMPLVRDDRALRQMLERPQALLLQQVPHGRLVGKKVRQLLRAHASRPLAAPDLAVRLNLSVRSLHRHLAGEGVSLRAIKNEVRRDAAMASLAHGHKPIKQVAGAVGFRNEGSFKRAFREWTGQTPAEYRRTLAGHSGNPPKAILAFPAHPA